MRNLALIATLGIVIACTAKNEVEGPGCIHGDFTTVVVDGYRQNEGVLDTLDLNWMADAVRCKAGVYTLLVPRDETSARYVLLREGARPVEVMRLGPESITVMDGWDVHATLTDSNLDGHADTVSYSTWRDTGEQIVDATDFNLDGQPRDSA